MNVGKEQLISTRSLDTLTVPSDTSNVKYVTDIDDVEERDFGACVGCPFDHLPSENWATGWTVGSANLLIPLDKGTLLLQPSKDDSKKTEKLGIENLITRFPLDNDTVQAMLTTEGQVGPQEDAFITAPWPVKGHNLEEINLTGIRSGQPARHCIMPPPRVPTQMNRDSMNNVLEMSILRLPVLIVHQHHLVKVQHTQRAPQSARGTSLA